MKSLDRLLGRPDADDFARIVIQAIRRTGTVDSIQVTPALNAEEIAELRGLLRQAVRSQ
jgi:hypothetical protein